MNQQAFYNYGLQLKICWTILHAYWLKWVITGFKGDTDLNIQM
jgi:hypothetical protein